jgi:hypothetical protein
MTLVVLALDAMDPFLVDDFECQHLDLGDLREIETYSYNLDHPYTLEVWPTVATGLHPREHGVGGEAHKDQQWDNPLLEFASRFTVHLDGDLRNRLGNLVESTTGASQRITETDAATIFDGEGRFVHNWPGVHDSAELQRVWDTANLERDLSREAFDRNLTTIAAQQFAWTEEMLRYEAALVATHVHTLDYFGHAYCDDREAYRAGYDWVDNWVGRIREAMAPEDDLLLLSDHGLEVAWNDADDDPGGHSWRACATATIDDGLFDDVYEAHDWIEAHVPAPGERDREAVDLPTDQLEELGYI